MAYKPSARWMMAMLVLAIAVLVMTAKSARSVQPERIYPNGKHLIPFLQPRTVGSEGAKQVRQWIKEHFRSLGWSCAEDSFKQSGHHFTNLICGPRQLKTPHLVLSAHLDSKWRVEGVEPDGSFIGATDAAWPCALLVEMATGIADLNAKIIFFDGEEAFGEWSAEDSLYGSRHLAGLWQQQGRLKEIKLMVLFDLLGAKDPNVFCLHGINRPAYAQLLQVQAALKRQLRTPLIFHGRNYADGYWVNDDHEPFMERGVPHVHIIPSPFPSVWHTPGDTVEALHADTIHDLTLILSQWVRVIQ